MRTDQAVNNITKIYYVAECIMIGFIYRYTMYRPFDTWSDPLCIGDEASNVRTN